MMDGDTHKTPRWVKVFGLVVAALALLFIGMILSGVGGRHGPARHLPLSDAGGNEMSNVTAHPASSHGKLAAHKPPEGRQQ